jgi:hypothetical protein
MGFCPACGAALKNRFSTHGKTTTLSAKSNTMPVLVRMTTFTNGIFIGLGTAILLGGLAILSILNANYWRLREYLVASGVEPQFTRFLLSDTVGLIALCAPMTVIGVYLLLLGALSQMSPVARAVLNSGNMRVRWGNGFFGGALVLAGISVQDMVWNIYSPDSFRFWYSIVSGIVSILLILIGLLLIRTARAE